MPTLEWNKTKWAKSLKRKQKQRNDAFYGQHWGDPGVTGLRYLIYKIRWGKKLPGNLSKVVKKYIVPYVGPGKVVLEIGPGGGRWTKYLLNARKLFLVELTPEFFPCLEERFPEHKHKFVFYQTSGYEMNRIEPGSIDFLFTFGTFVHIDPEGIEQYLGEIKKVLKPGAVAVVQYSDKTKPRAAEIPVFSEMDGQKMETFINANGLTLIRHDRSLLNHSNIAVFGIKTD